MSDMKSNVPMHSAFTDDMAAVPSGMNREETDAFFSRGEVPFWAKKPTADQKLVGGEDYDSDPSSMRLSPKAQLVLGFGK